MIPVILRRLPAPDAESRGPIGMGRSRPFAVLLSTEGHALVALCIHLANLFYLASFLGRDMLWLRALTCAGLTLGIVFFSCQATPMYGPTAWHIVFLAINAAQIRRLVRDRRQLRLSREQERFGAAALGNLSRDELLTLLTRLMSEGPEGLRDLRRACAQPLGADERVLRDLAFSRLTRQELLNLLTRRLWNSIRRRRPARWGGPRRHVGRAAPGRTERDAARGPVAG